MVKRIGVVWSCVIALWLCNLVDFATAQQGDRRVALVVGNGAYTQASDQLPNPPNDARDMADKLRSLGFEVIEALDADLIQMLGKLQAFGDALEGASAGLFFYAGHGMEYAGKNYLFPTDASLDRETDVRLRLIDMEDVLWAMELAVPARLVILDACRNNPLALQLKESLDSNRSGKVRQGLTALNSQVGTFVAFATAPGEVALDGSGRNSPFTEAMLAHLGSSGMDADQLLREVRSDVIEATGGQQVPWNLSSLREPFLFNPAGAEPAAGEELDALVWESIANSGDPDMFRAYLDRFGGGGRYASQAREKLTLTSARSFLGGEQMNALDLFRSAMDKPIVMNCNKSGNTPHFGLGAAPVPFQAIPLFGDGLNASRSAVLGAENTKNLVSSSSFELSITLVQAANAGCGVSDRIDTGGRSAQWQSWHYLVANGGTLVDRERDNWSGKGGNFRIESDIVSLSPHLAKSAPDHTQCRAFIGYNQTRWRTFGGVACGSETPRLDHLSGYFDLLEWE